MQAGGRRGDSLEDRLQRAQRLGHNAARLGRVGQDPIDTPASIEAAAHGDAVIQRDIGYEYQMLRSQVEIENISGGGAIVGWAPTKDGDNLELKTEVLEQEREVESVVKQMAAVGRRVADSYEGEEIDIGNKRITVHQKDDSAQPQVNFDLPARAMGGPFAGTLETLVQEKYFDAAVPGFGWQKEATRQQMGVLRQAIANAGANLPNQLLIDAYYGAPKDVASWPEELYQDLRAVILLNFTQHYQTARKLGGLLKDVPLLSKTDPAELVDAIVSGIEEAEGNYLDPFTIEDKVNKLISDQVAALMANTNLGVQARTEAQQRIAQNEGRLYDWAQKPSKGVVPEEAEPLSGLLLELRRVPVLLVDKWVEFALGAFRRLSRLFHPAEPESSSSGSEEASDDDAGGFWS